MNIPSKTQVERHVFDPCHRIGSDSFTELLKIVPECFQNAEKLSSTSVDTVRVHVTAGLIDRLTGTVTDKNLDRFPCDSDRPGTDSVSVDEAGGELLR